MYKMYTWKMNTDDMLSAKDTISLVQAICQNISFIHQVVIKSDESDRLLYKLIVFSRVHSTTRSVRRTVGPLVGPSVTLSFLGAFGRFWSYCSCPTAWLVYLFTAPAHPHATCVTV